MALHSRTTWPDRDTFPHRQRHLPRHAERGGVAPPASRRTAVAGGGPYFAVLHSNGCHFSLGAEETAKEIIIFSAAPDKVGSIIHSGGRRGDRFGQHDGRAGGRRLGPPPRRLPRQRRMWLGLWRKRRRFGWRES